MSTLEQEILEKFDLLDDEAKARVLRRLNEDTSLQFDSNDDWLKAITKLNREFQHSVGKLPAGTIQAMINETREDM